jgi:hypothetical protein
MNHAGAAAVPRPSFVGLIGHFAGHLQSTIIRARLR